MASPLERIVRSGAAYQASAFLSAGLAIVTYKAYTEEIGVEVLGQADLILAWLIMGSIGARLGFGEAVLRHWPIGGDDGRPRLQRTVQGAVAVTSGLFALVVWLLAPTVAGWLPKIDDPWVVRIAGAGLFFYCNLDLAQTILRARDDRRTYLIASLSNVLLTTALTLLLVVVLGNGVRGYLIGNYGATAVIVLALWWRERGVLLGRVTTQPALVDGREPLVAVTVPDDAAHEHRTLTGGEASEPAAGLAGAPPHVPEETDAQARRAARGNLRALLRFGLPTIPSDAAIFGFNLLDRTILLATGSAAVASAALGVFSGASKIAVGVILIARAFQLAFPPLVYGIVEAGRASAVYATALRGYAVFLGGAVAAFALCAPWTVQLLIGVPPGEPDLRPEIVEAIPLLTAAWALWGAVPVMATIAGRLGATELTVPAALVGLAINVAGLLLLVPPYGAMGAAYALVAAYVVVITAMHLLTRRHFRVAFDWPRIVLALGLSAATCLLAGPLADAAQLGWGPAAARLGMFVVLVVLLWQLTLRADERREILATLQRLSSRP